MKPGNQVRLSLYQGCQVRLTMIVEAEWNRRLGRGFNSRRLHHQHLAAFKGPSSPGSGMDRNPAGMSGVLLMGATWVRLGAIKARLRLG